MAARITDKERLDWFDKHAVRLQWHDQGCTYCDFSGDGWQIDGGMTHLTVRQAIDAAIRVERKKR